MFNSLFIMSLRAIAKQSRIWIATGFACGFYPYNNLWNDTISPARACLNKGKPGPVDVMRLCLLKRGAFP
jgi:hypothetical protein